MICAETSASSLSISVGINSLARGETKGETKGAIATAILATYNAYI